MILPADKGHAGIVLNTDTYHDKNMNTLTEVGPYQFPNNGPAEPKTNRPANNPPQRGCRMGR